MKIRCEKCGVHLDLAGYAGRTDVLTVKCTQCGHLIRGVEMTSESAVTQDMVTESWRIRRKNGDLLAFDGLKTLRRWVSEGRVSGTDEVSADGKSWRPLSTLMDDPQLGLGSGKPKGPPPIPATAFNVPDNTLDSPDPEEELDASILSLDGGDFPDDAVDRRDLSAPLPKAVVAPLSGLASVPTKPLTGQGPMSTATGFVPLPSMAPDSAEKAQALDDAPTINRQLPESQQEALRTLDDQPTLNYRSQSPVTLEPDPVDVDDVDEPSLAEAVEHLVTSDHLPVIKAEQITFSDDRHDAPDETSGRVKQGGRFGAFLAGVILALLLGGAALYYGGLLKAPDVQVKSPAPVVKTGVTQAQLETFAQAVSESRSGAKGAADSALRAYGVLLSDLGDSAGERSLKASIHMERARTYLAVVRSTSASGQKPTAAQLNSVASSLSAARSLNGKPRSGILIEMEMLAFRGPPSSVKALLETARAEGVDEKKLSGLLARMNIQTGKPDTPQVGGSTKVKSEVADSVVVKTADVAPKGTPKSTGSTMTETSKVKSGLAVAAGKKKKKRVSGVAQTASLDFDSAMKKGYQLLERGRVAKAREAFLGAARARPDRPEPHANLGWCSIESRQYDGAIRFFRKALSVRKRYSDGLFGLGVAFEKKGNTAEAVKAFTEYLEHHPNGRKARMIKARLERLTP